MKESDEWDETRLGCGLIVFIGMLLWGLLIFASMMLLKGG